jgi:triacylglycerol lipase
MTTDTTSNRRARKGAWRIALAGATLCASAALAAPVGATEATVDAYADATLTAPYKHDPVLFVHGFTRTSADFDAYKERYIKNGWRADRLYTIDYNSFYPNAYTATLISARVDQILAETGASKVDIVAHSMGSYGSRYYIKYLGGAAKVDAWVSVSGPNHGTITTNNAQCLAIPSCAEMVPGSAFLTALNAGDETPGDVRYFTLWSQGDDLVVPAVGTTLEGAKNWENEEVLTHMAMAVDEETIVHTRNFVR